MNVTRHQTAHGESIAVEKDGKKVSLFVTRGTPFSPQQAAVNFLSQLYEGTVKEPVPTDLQELLDKLK